MMHEILLLVLISIFFTSIAFISAKILIKKLKINHPKNRSIIYLFVILTASMIFIIPFTTLGSTIYQDNSSSIEPIKEEKLASIIIIKENLQLNCISTEDNQFSTSINSRVYEKVSQIIFKIIKKSSYESFEEISGKSNPTNNFLSTPTVYPSSKINPTYYYNEYLFEPKFENTQINNPSEEIESINNDEITDTSSVSVFWLANLILICISGIYLILSMSLGKTLILRSMNTKKCKDESIIRLISEISKEFNIKIPKIYLYDGSPNAFVFSYPTTIVISNDLIKILSKEELKQAIRHELAHIKNKDIILKPILQSIRIIFFYNPFVHLIAYKIMKDRELLADSYKLTSKSQKVKYMGALIKIHEFTSSQRKTILSTAIYNAITMPLVSYKPKKLTISERFDNLFSEIMKKSVCTLIICIILLLSNISLLTIAQNFIQKPSENIEINDDNYEVIYIINEISPIYQTYQMIENDNVHFSTNNYYTSYNQNDCYQSKTDLFMNTFSIKYYILEITYYLNCNDYMLNTCDSCFTY